MYNHFASENFFRKEFELSSLSFKIWRCFIKSEDLNKKFLQRANRRIKQNGKFSRWLRQIAWLQTQNNRPFRKTSAGYSISKNCNKIKDSNCQWMCPLAELKFILKKNMTIFNLLFFFSININKNRKVNSVDCNLFLTQ